ncbi:MAG: hypothetical protein JWM10_1069 [Myxococcaceae bacterium]|nr:hypothetical protein [Myxococcaceae bacterium]
MSPKDPIDRDPAELDVRAQMTRPLLSAAHGAADRIASELRAMGGDQGASFAPLRESVRSLSTALFHLHALYGGILSPSAAQPTSLDVVALAWKLADEYVDGAIRLRVDSRVPTAMVLVEGGRLRRVLCFVIERAAAAQTDGWVSVRVRIEAERVGMEFPWDDDPTSLAVLAEERRWITQETALLGGTASFERDAVTVWLPREAAVADAQAPEVLVREVLDLRRERDTFIHHVERATSELVAIQSETEDLRRRMSRMERSMAGAVNDLNRTFAGINALAAMVKGNPALRTELLAAASLGEARVDQFIDEVEAVTSDGALSLVRDGTDDPRGEPGSLAAPRAAVFDEDDENTSVRATGTRKR